jgi:hypothetical protein
MDKGMENAGCCWNFKWEASSDSSLEVGQFWSVSPNKDTSVDTGKRSMAVLHHSTILWRERSGKIIEAMALYTMSRLFLVGEQGQEG